MARKRRNPPDKIDPNKLKTRDPAQLAIIAGQVKAGVHKDRKKDADKKRCRKPVRDDD